MKQEKMDIRSTPKFCKKLIYGNSDSPDILLGLIITEDDLFITFLTAHNTRRISKKAIISIEDTEEVFIGDSQ